MIVILELEHEIERNTLFHLTLPPFQNQASFGVYLKVLKVEVTSGLFRFRSICEIVPISDRTEAVVKWWPGWIKTEREQTKSKETSDFIQNRRWFFLESYFSEKFRRNVSEASKLVFGVAIAVVLLVGLYYLLSSIRIRGVKPAGMEEVFRGIRDAFN